jgi:hypothetical protein
MGSNQREAELEREETEVKRLVRMNIKRQNEERGETEVKR